jgi:hypothetical protein
MGYFWHKAKMQDQSFPRYLDARHIIVTIQAVQYVGLCCLLVRIHHRTINKYLIILLWETHTATKFVLTRRLYLVLFMGGFAHIRAMSPHYLVVKTLVLLKNAFRRVQFRSSTPAVELKGGYAIRLPRAFRTISIANLSIGPKPSNQ